MAQAGTLLVCGDAGPGLGDSLYEAVIYVGGTIGSLGADAQVVELTADDATVIAVLLAESGVEGPAPETFTKVTSARTLYHFTHPTPGSGAHAY